MTERDQRKTGGGAGLAESKPSQRIRVPLGTPRPRLIVPGLFVRLMHFAFRPESWAEALKLPLRYVLTPLIVAILIAGLLAGVGFAARLHRGLGAFAAHYDASYAAMVYKDGKLSIAPGATFSRPIRITAAGGDVVIDPTGQTTVNDLRETGGVLITDAFVYQRVMGLENKIALKDFYPFANLADGTVIDGAFLKQMVAETGASLAGLFGLAVGLVTALGEIIWATVMVVLVAPVVVLAAASLKLRHRTAARAGAAVLIPLVLLGGVLSALGVSPHQTFRAEYVPFFWFVATVMLASWAGWLATRLFRPNSRKPRQM